MSKVSRDVHSHGRTTDFFDSPRTHAIVRMVRLARLRIVALWTCAFVPRLWTTRSLASCSVSLARVVSDDEGDTIENEEHMGEMRADGRRNMDANGMAFKR